MYATYVPNPTAADGQLGTGSNLIPIPESNVLITYVPDPNKADGKGVSLASEDIFSWDGNPNGHVTAAGPAIVLGEGSTEGNLWFKVIKTKSNTGWFPVLQ